MITMIKAIYSPSLRLRFQMYDDGTTVGFSHSSQTLAAATERVNAHVQNNVDPRVFVLDTPENTQKGIDAANDWKVIYEV